MTKTIILNIEIVRSDILLITGTHLILSKIRLRCIFQALEREKSYPQRNNDHLFSGIHARDNLDRIDVLKA